MGLPKLTFPPFSPPVGNGFCWLSRAENGRNHEVEAFLIGRVVPSAGGGGRARRRHPLRPPWVAHPWSKKSSSIALIRIGGRCGSRTRTPTSCCTIRRASLPPLISTTRFGSWRGEVLGGGSEVGSRYEHALSERSRPPARTKFLTSPTPRPRCFRWRSSSLGRTPRRDELVFLDGAIDSSITGYAQSQRPIEESASAQRPPALDERGKSPEVPDVQATRGLGQKTLSFIGNPVYTSPDLFHQGGTKPAGA